MTPTAAGQGAEEQGQPSYWLLVAVLLVIFIYAFVDRMILSLLVEPTLFGQALGPLIVAWGSQHLFSGPSALARSMALNCTIFGLATIAAAVVLRVRLARGGPMEARSSARFEAENSSSCCCSAPGY